MIAKFKNQAEYSQFRAWHIEGSCLAQRMSLSGEGGQFTVPNHWLQYAALEVEWPLWLPDMFKDG